MAHIDSTPGDFTADPSIARFTQYAMILNDEQIARQLRAAYGDRVPGSGARWLDQNRPGWRTCSIEGCERRHNARGWCHTHYERWRLRGDPMAGRPPRPSPTHEEIEAEMRAALAEAIREAGR